jgi:dienelactone hydrolase
VGRRRRIAGDVSHEGITPDMIAIEYEADGISATGYLASGSSERRVPGILVAHEALGVNDHVKARAQTLTDLGYMAFVLDLYGEANLPLATAQSRHAELMAAQGAMFRRATAALQILASHQSVDDNRLAAIGFCQGGITALELARGGAPIRAAIGFHPGLMRPAGSASGKIVAKVLMMIGDSDPVIPPEDRAAFALEMNAAGADWQLHVFGGVWHSFTNPAVDALKIPGMVYNPSADRRSWALMRATLEEAFQERPSDGGR